MKKNLLAIASVIAVSACTSFKEPATINQIDISQSYSTTVFEIYFPGPDSVHVQDFVALANKRLPGFIRVSQSPDSLIQDCFAIKRFNSTGEEFQPPDMEFLSYSSVDLSEDEMKRLERAGSGLTIILLADRDSILQKQHAITTLIGDWTRNHDVFIGDINTRRFYSPGSWSEHRVEPFVGSNMLQEIVFHSYRDGEFCRLVSLGMNKFCLPDISIKGVPCSDQKSFGNLANAVVATLIEQPAISVDSTLMLDLQSIKDHDLKVYVTTDIFDDAEQQGEVNLMSVEPAEGDNINDQLEIVFRDPAFSTAQEEQSAILKKLFGFDESLVTVTHDDEILAASMRAKEKLPELKDIFNKGLDRGYSLLLKAPFKTNAGGNEWMWIEVIRWNDTEITGVLQNEPFDVPDLKAGARVTVKQNDVFDYILYKPDGTSEGNETGELIDRSSGQ